MSDRQNNQQQWIENVHIIEALASEYLSIVKVDLETGCVVPLKTYGLFYSVGSTISWDTFVHNYVEKRVFSDDKHLVENLRITDLISFYENKTSLFPLEMRCLSRGETFSWVSIQAYAIQGRELLITMRDINENIMMKKIVEMYVYKNCDFMVLIDAYRNSYIMFNGQEGTPLPPERGDDFESEVRRYNQKYVVPEEVEYATENMMIHHLQKMLDKNEKYEFTAGFINDQGEYRRSRLQFHYYDKKAGLILSTRTDVTQIYLDEGEKEKRLAAALREAKQDSITGLYNKKAVTDLVFHALNHQYRAQAVIFFIDIDNFKLVNDTLGHQMGDKILHLVGEKLTKIAGKDGIAGRIGGDEFLIYLPVTQSMETIKRYANEICACLDHEVHLKAKNLSVACSVGISVYPQDGTDYEKLLYKADQALYSAKRHGKSQFAFYDEIQMK